MPDLLTERTITWTDAGHTVERVKIDPNGFFWLDGIKSKLVGFHFGAAIIHDASNWNCAVGATTPTKWWTPQANLDYLETQMSLLQAGGFRIVRLYIEYTYLPSTIDEANAYRALLDLFKKHKILVMVSVPCRWMTGFNCASPTSGFVIPGGTGGDTLSTWITRTVSVLSGYDNIVAVQLDNELNIYSGAQNYTAAAAAAHVTWLKGIFKTAMPNTPVTHNLGANSSETAFSSAILPLCDFPAFNVYGVDSAHIKSLLTSKTAILGVAGNFWLLEINKLLDYNFIIDPYVGSKQFTWLFVNEAFNAGASIVLIDCLQHYYWDDAQPWSVNRGYGFLNWDNTPKPQLTSLGAYHDYLQKVGALV